MEWNGMAKQIKLIAQLIKPDILAIDLIDFVFVCGFRGSNSYRRHQYKRIEVEKG